MNLYKREEYGGQDIFAGPAIESYVTQEITIDANEASTGETALVKRGTALVKVDGVHKVLTADADTVDAIAAYDVDTSTGAVKTTGFEKGGFGDMFIDFGAATLAAVEAKARQNGIRFYPVFK